MRFTTSEKIAMFASGRFDIIFLRFWASFIPEAKEFHKTDMFSPVTVMKAFRLVIGWC